jgi:hypothetical protein
MLVDGVAAGKRSLTEDHLGVLMGCGELARVYARQHRFEEAEKLCLNTIQKLEKSRGHEHPDCVYALWKLGQLYELEGKIVKAADVCEIALQRASIRLTKQHPLYKKIECQLLLLRNCESTLTAKQPDSGCKTVEAAYQFKALQNTHTW